MAAHADSSPLVVASHDRDQPPQDNDPARPKDPTVEPDPRKSCHERPKIRLYRKTVKRFLRSTAHSRPPFPPRPSEAIQYPSPALAKDLARFSRHGGPDLSDLRGYPLKDTDRDLVTVAGTRPRSRYLTMTTTYDPDLHQHLTDHAIHEIQVLEPQDSEGIKAVLGVRRPSLSPSTFSLGAFKDFQDSNFEARDEADVRYHVIPTITGRKRAEHPHAFNTVFGNLKALTDDSVASPKPDMYYGARPEQLNPSIQKELSVFIVPTTLGEKPIAPNFFLEIKGPSGTLKMAESQVRYVGAMGARAMHVLQNFGKDEPVFDETAYTFSATYCARTLILYAHHVTAPTTSGGPPEYHMIKLRGFDLTDNLATFLEGVTAFRNLRDMAKQHRDSFIQAANASINPENPYQKPFPRPAGGCQPRLAIPESSTPQQNVTNNRHLHLSPNDGQAISSSTSIPHPDEGVGVSAAVNDLPISAGTGNTTSTGSLRRRSKRKRSQESLQEGQPSKIRKR